MTNRCLSLKKIQIIDFVLNDTVLYLDTHPNCKEALEYYNKYLEMRKSAVKEYVSLFGPIELTDTNVCGGSWKWSDGPCPWEKRCCE